MGGDGNMRAKILGFFPDPYPNLSVPPYRPVPTTPDALRTRWEDFLARSRFANDLVLHLHVPYCVRKCDYCDCSSDAIRSRTDLDGYRQAVVREMDLLAATFEGVVFRRLYVGGGTPNLLPAAALGALLDEGNRRFRFREGAVRCVEFSPELTRRNRLRAARDAGINRVSLGVQTLNGTVLARVGRPRAGPDVSRRAYDLVREAGFDEVNVDLIFGLDDETEASFQAGLDEVLRWGPDTVTVQLVHDCATTRVFRTDRHRQEVEDLYVAAVERWAREVPVVHPDYSCVIRPATCVFTRRTFRRRWNEWPDFYSFRDRVTFSTLGFGVYSHSKMHGACGYQRQPLSGNSEQPPYVFHTYTEELEAVMDMACALTTDGRFDLDEVAARYGGLSERVEAVLSHLVEEGQLQREGPVVTAPPGSENPLLSTVRLLSYECRPKDR